MDYYICPSCKTENEEYIKYCKKCGTWLLSDTFPAKKVRRKKKSIVWKVIGFVIGIPVTLFIILIVVALIFGDKVETVNNKPEDTKASVSQSKAGLSRSTPAALGEEVTGKINQFIILNASDKESFEVTIRVDKAIRGDEAWGLIKVSNQFNAPAAEGFEYMLAQIHVRLNKASNNDAQLNISAPQFSAISASGNEYSPAIVTLKDGITSKLYAGSEHTGWAAFLIKQGDDPVIAVARDSQGRNGLWFKTK